VNADWPVTTDPTVTTDPLVSRDDELKAMLDRAAIREVLYRYCRGADRCDEELLRSCYHADGLDRHGRFQGDATDFAHWVISVQLTTSITTQHALSNIVIELAGDTAWVESAFTATHIRPGDGDAPDEPRLETFWGRYVDRFEKRAGSWAIATREVVHDWSEKRALGPQMSHVETYIAGRRDREDLSYRR
jgi:SnoaL-like protein